MDEKIDTNTIAYIADNLYNDWSSLGNALGMSSAVMQINQSLMGIPIASGALEMLRLWKSRGKNVSIKCLCSSLVRVHRTDLSEFVLYHNSAKYKIVSDSLLIELSGYIQSCWERLSICLGLNHNDINPILALLSASKITSSRSPAYQLLHCWTQQIREANVTHERKSLIMALSEIRRMDLGNHLV